MAASDLIPEQVSTVSRSGTTVLALAVTATLGLVLLLLGAVALFGRASDGEPVAVVGLPSQAAAKAPEHTATSSAATAATPPAALPAPDASVLHITGIMRAGNALIADPALIEQTAAGPLPRIADDGRTPMQAYAPAAAAASGPRIALVVTGLGISAKAMAAALDQLPPSVTLAIAPYGSTAQGWLNQARQRGHEVLLEVPMEPYDFPDSDPGPNTLRAGASEDANIARLTAAMTRLTGYAGITNLEGSRLMADSQALAPVLTFVARRGLLFFEGGAGAQSVGNSLAATLKSPYVRGESAIDSDPDPAAIDQRLSQLEAQARSGGSAAATASAYPVTLARIKNWAQGLSGRGFVLVPASAIVAPAK